MPTLDDHETRLANVEAAVFRPGTGLADTHTLAASASEEAGDAKVSARVVNALRETQLEHGETLKAHGEMLDALNSKVDEGFGKLTRGMMEIKNLLTAALGKSEDEVDGE